MTKSVFFFVLLLASFAFGSFAGNSKPLCSTTDGGSSCVGRADDTCNVDGPRRDCGHVGTDQPQCESKGCCWSPKNNNPWCFYKTGPVTNYIVDDIKSNDAGMKITLKINGTSEFGSPFGANIYPIVVNVSYQTEDRLHIKIFDPNNKRYEIPTKFSPAPQEPSTSPSKMNYKFKCSNKGETFSFTVTRTDDGSVLFDSSVGQGLQFADQYLSIGTSLPEGYNLYGLGEHVTPYLRIQPRTITMWNFDTATPEYNNLYGSHPFYLELRPSGKAHGVFLRNSNGMDVVVDDKSLTYNVIGGVLDFYFFMGSKPESVIAQYQEVIGRPHMPPYWALGFHQCRYGYPNVQAIEEVVAKYQENSIPLDTMWTDIDYMDQYKDFTLDPQNFPEKEMNNFVSKLHSNGQHYVVIIDPGIKTEKGYSAYDDGLKMDVFVKNKDGDVFTGKVWPGITAFPDFFHPDANDYWKKQISGFLKLLPVDGLWIDMNEISNFCTGECKGDSYNGSHNNTNSRPNAQSSSQLDEFDPNNPPYSIQNQGSTTPLNVKTLDMDAVHHGGVLEYDAHNLFGLTESIATNSALEKLTKKRSLVISRSTFPGSGRVAGHWTGDNHAGFEDMYTSIPDILNFQMYGVPLIGADICGFIGDTNEELCSRWMELGAFYPFSRNHNTIGDKSQEPYTWPSVAAISRKVLGIRYSLLPHYYTLFYTAHIPTSDVSSATVLRPLFFEFPSDPQTYDISKQFMIGSSIMVSPVLDQGATSVKAYFPKGAIWYDFYSYKTTSKGGESLTLDTPIDHIQLHIRGGSIIPMQQPAMTTNKTRMNPFGLLVGLDSQGSASGSLYWDDGVTINPTDYQYTTYSLSKGQLTSTLSSPKVYSDDMPQLTNVTIIGIQDKPTAVTLNKKDIKTFSYNDMIKTLYITVSVSMKDALRLNWK